MGKDEVYSWRVSAETKAELEFEARRNGLSLAGLLERISTEWLQAQRSEFGADTAEQKRLQAKAALSFGRIAGGDPGRSERIRDTVRARLLGGREKLREMDAAARDDEASVPRRSPSRHKREQPENRAKRPARRS